MSRQVWSLLERLDRRYSNVVAGNGGRLTRWLVGPAAVLIGFLLLRQVNLTEQATASLVAPLMCVAAAMTFAITAIGFVSGSGDGDGIEMP